MVDLKQRIRQKYDKKRVLYWALFQGRLNRAIAGTKQIISTQEKGEEVEKSRSS